MENFKFFMSYVFVRDGNIDISGIFSKECLVEWICTKNKKPEHFVKTVKDITSGRKGIHFEERVERVVLDRLRTPRIWECFENTDYTFGKQGSNKIIGYHEKQLQDWINGINDGIIDWD